MPLRRIGLRIIQSEKTQIRTARLPCHGCVDNHLIAGQDIEHLKRAHELVRGVHTDPGGFISFQIIEPHQTQLQKLLVFVFTAIILHDPAKGCIQLFPFPISPPVLSWGKVKALKSVMIYRKQAPQLVISRIKLSIRSLLPGPLRLGLQSRLNGTASISGDADLLK